MGKIVQSNSYLFENDSSWVNIGPGLHRKIMGYDGQIMMVKFRFDEGAVGNPHTHYHSQTAYVVSGKFEVTIGEETKILSSGDGYYVSPNVLHGAKCIEAGIVVDVFSPIRNDFL